MNENRANVDPAELAKFDALAACWSDPSELAAWMRAADLELRELTGMSYNPFTGSYALTSDISVNYFAHAERPATEA